MKRRGWAPQGLYFLVGAVAIGKAVPLSYKRGTAAEASVTVTVGPLVLD